MERLRKRFEQVRWVPAADPDISFSEQCGSEVDILTATKASVHRGFCGWVPDLLTSGCVIL